YIVLLFFSSRRRHTISKRDWSSDVCSSDLLFPKLGGEDVRGHVHGFDPGGARAAGVDEDHPLGGGKSVLLELDVDRPCARIVVVDGHGDRTALEILPARVPLDRLLVVFLETRLGGGGGRPVRLLKHRC